jgi:hypothetical protein
VAGSLPVLKPREVAALLERLGFVEARQRGPHRQYRHADGRGTGHAPRLLPALRRHAVTVLGTHFHHPTAGRIVRHDDGWRFHVDTPCI